MEFKGTTNEYLRLEQITSANCFIAKEKIESALTLFWMTADGNRLKIDGKDYVFQLNEIICVTEFHHMEVNQVTSMRLVRFNRPFFCIIDHDSEVGCRGILFFGASQLPVFRIPETELEKFEQPSGQRAGSYQPRGEPGERLPLLPERPYGFG